MTILSDTQILDLCRKEGMISPFYDRLVSREFLKEEGSTKLHDPEGKKVISYGLSSFGYDIRCGNKFKLFTNINSTIIDPKCLDPNAFIDFEGDVCIVPPNSFVLAHSVEYMKIPRDVQTICLNKSTYARCFSGETKVRLVDGSSASFLELIQRTSGGEKIFGFSLDDNGKIVVSEFISPRKISSEEVIEVTLDNGEIIKCTPDHEFILKDGSEVMAENLKVGESLFPLYLIEARGYLSAVQPHKWTLSPVHQMADGWNIRHGAYSSIIENNFHRHHIDGNKLNNVPGNIERKPAGDHVREHNSERIKDKAWAKSFSKSISDAYKKYSADPVWLDRRIEQCKKGGNALWNLPEHSEARDKIKTGLADFWNSDKSLETRKARREMLRKRNSDIAFIESNREKMANLWKDKEWAAMMRENCRMMSIRSEIDEQKVREAFNNTGSIREAARYLKCDRTVFRRFREIVAEFKEKWNASKLTSDDFYKVLLNTGSITKAAKLLKIGRNYATKHFQEAVLRFYGSPVAENHKVISVKRTGEITDTYCLTAPEFGNFALAAGVFVNNCGLVGNVTPLEAGWEGYVTLEFSNTTSLPVKLYANEGCFQVLFFKGSMPPMVSYADRGGKYMFQPAEPVTGKLK